MTGNNNGRRVARAGVVENRTYVRIFLADMPMTPRKIRAHGARPKLRGRRLAGRYFAHGNRTVGKSAA
jgi:hypothetical protein